MNPYMTQTPNANDVALVESIVSQRLKGSILWMVVGLLTTLGIGVATLMNPSWARFGASNFNILLIAEVAVVFLFSMRTYKANVMSLYAMFFIYSALNGVTLSLVSLAYGIMEATVPALIGALAFFVAFSIVGLTTKKNLAGLTPYLVAAIFGMIIVSLVFMAASYFSIPYLSSISYSTISLILGYVGVVVFSIFTAVDMNMIKNSVTQLALSEDETILDRIEIAGALSLYLDFINLFLSLLRIFGNRR